MSKRNRKIRANGVPPARWPKLSEIPECNLPADQPPIMLPDADLAHVTPLDNGWRVRCRSCGATQDLRIVDAGIFAPRVQHVYGPDGKLRYQTLAHADRFCPALLHLDDVAREYEERTRTTPASAPSRSKRDLLAWVAALMQQWGLVDGGVHSLEYAHESSCALSGADGGVPEPWSRCSCALDITLIVDAGTPHAHRVELVRDGIPLPVVRPRIH